MTPHDKDAIVAGTPRVGHLATTTGPWRRSQPVNLQSLTARPSPGRGALAFGVHSTPNVTPLRFDHREDLPVRRARPNRPLNGKAVRQSEWNTERQIEPNSVAAANGSANGKTNGHHQNDSIRDDDFVLGDDEIPDETLSAALEHDDDLDHLPEEGSPESHIDDPIRMYLMQMGEIPMLEPGGRDLLGSPDRRNPHSVSQFAAGQ